MIPVWYHSSLLFFKKREGPEGEVTTVKPWRRKSNESQIHICHLGSHSGVIWHHVEWYIGTNFSGGLAASIFRVVVFCLEYGGLKLLRKFDTEVPRGRIFVMRCVSHSFCCMTAQTCAAERVCRNMKSTNKLSECWCVPVITFTAVNCGLSFSDCCRFLWYGKSNLRFEYPAFQQKDAECNISLSGHLLTSWNRVTLRKLTVV